MLRLTDLREILRYVPQFREKVFVIAMDGAVVDDDNFGNLLLDIALCAACELASRSFTGQVFRRAGLRSRPGRPRPIPTESASRTR